MYVLSGAERREWMGMRVAGIIIHNYGSFPHSLRLAPVFFGRVFLYIFPQLPIHRTPDLHLCIVLPEQVADGDRLPLAERGMEAMATAAEKMGIIVVNNG